MKSTLVISKTQFNAYEFVRQPGVTNMWDVPLVSSLSTLDAETIVTIMTNDNELHARYASSDSGANAAESRHGDAG